MKTLNALIMMTLFFLVFPFVSICGINPENEESCRDNSMLTPTNYTITVDITGSIDCAALSDCSCTFQIRLYACTSCTPPSGCTQIDAKNFIPGTSSYTFNERVDPSVYSCICAYFVDTTPGGCGCHFVADHDCHNIANDPNTDFTLRLQPCGN